MWGSRAVRAIYLIPQAKITKGLVPTRYFLLFLHLHLHLLTYSPTPTHLHLLTYTFTFTFTSTSGRCFHQNTHLNLMGYPNNPLHRVGFRGGIYAYPNMLKVAGKRKESEVR